MDTKMAGDLIQVTLSLVAAIAFGIAGLGLLGSLLGLETAVGVACLGLAALALLFGIKD